MNEKMKILKMLEEGKITADDAAKLLEALGENKRREKSTKVADSIIEGVSSVVGAIPEVIGGAFSTTFGEEKGFEVGEGDEFQLKSVGSSVNLSNIEKKELVVKPAGGLVKTKKENSTISSKIVGGSADIQFPSTIGISIKDAGGTIEGVGNPVLSMKQVGGSAQLSFDHIEDVDILSKGGSVTLFLGECDFSFDIEALKGNITFDIPADFTEKEDDKVKGTIKKGKGKLYIRSSFGDVSVLQKKEEVKK
jgi:DUF4097 and DUF4098 domain-containing protein YvlB